MASKRGVPMLDTASAAAVQQKNLRIIETFIASENSRELQLAQCKSVDKRAMLEMEFALARAHESKLLHRMMQRKGDGADADRLEEEVHAMVLASSKRMQEIEANGAVIKSPFGKKHPAKKRTVIAGPRESSKTAMPAIKQQREAIKAAPSSAKSSHTRDAAQLGRIPLKKPAPPKLDNALVTLPPRVNQPYSRSKDDVREAQTPTTTNTAPADPSKLPDLHPRSPATLPEGAAIAAETRPPSAFESFFHAYMGTPSELLFAKVKEVVLDVEGFEVRVRKKPSSSRPVTADAPPNGVRGVRALKVQHALEEVQSDLNTRCVPMDDLPVEELVRPDVGASNFCLLSDNDRLESKEEAEIAQPDAGSQPAPASPQEPSPAPQVAAPAPDRDPLEESPTLEENTFVEQRCEQRSNDCPSSPPRLAQVHEVSVAVVDAVVANALQLLYSSPTEGALDDPDGFDHEGTDLAPLTPLASPVKSTDPAFHAPNTQDLLAVAESFLPAQDARDATNQPVAPTTSTETTEAAIEMQRMVRGHHGRKHFQATLYQEAQSCGVLGAMPGTVQGATGWYQEQATLTAHYFVVLPSGEWRPKVKVTCPHVILTPYDMKRYVHSVINVVDLD